MEATRSTETMDERRIRLGLKDVSSARSKSLEIAHAVVDDEVFARIAQALRLARNETITLPAHRFEGLSRGRGWARKGRGGGAVWGERTDGGYRVGVGRWTVGGSDGFSRKGEDTWTVQHIQVGSATWTVAN